MATQTKILLEQLSGTGIDFKINYSYRLLGQQWPLDQFGNFPFLDFTPLPVKVAGQDSGTICETLASISKEGNKSQEYKSFPTVPILKFLLLMTKLFGFCRSY